MEYARTIVIVIKIDYVMVLWFINDLNSLTTWHGTWFPLMTYSLKGELTNFLPWKYVGIIFVIPMENSHKFSTHHAAQLSQFKK